MIDVAPGLDLPSIGVEGDGVYAALEIGTDCSLPTGLHIPPRLAVVHDDEARHRRPVADNRVIVAPL
ncbi:MAG: hypothetical protein ABIR98_03080 [Usitatibacter sp.]